MLLIPRLSGRVPLDPASIVPIVKPWTPASAGVLNRLTSLYISANILHMLKIRLQRTGRKNNPSFRVVVGEHTNSAQSGKFIEVVGSYEPKSGVVSLKADRIKHWIKSGAQPSGTVHNFLVDQKIVDGPKKNVMPKRTKQVKKEEAK